MVAVTLHVPAAVFDNTAPVTEQLPESTTYDTVPVPEPPLVVNDNGEPNVPDVDVIVNADWLATLMVILVDADDTTM